MLLDVEIELGGLLLVDVDLVVLNLKLFNFLQLHNWRLAPDLIEFDVRSLALFEAETVILTHLVELLELDIRSLAIEFLEVVIHVYLSNLRDVEILVVLREIQFRGLHLDLGELAQIHIGFG